ncbi:MAG: PdxA family protein [Oligoflexales bacterium]
MELSKNAPRLFITLGDPFSVNVELLAKALSDSSEVATILIGSRWHWDSQWEKISPRSLSISAIQDFNAIQTPGYYFYDVGCREETSACDLSTEERGRIAVASLGVLKSVTWSENAAVITCPIDKSAAAAAGFKHAGQTEYFEALWARPTIMVLAGSKLKVGLATNHIPLKLVSDHLTIKSVAQKVELLSLTVQQVFGISRPKIAVCGLNPHCGENGMWGHEDSDIIAPAVSVTKANGFDVTGPVPADTAFYYAFEGKYDAVLAMYHDQGLGPLKLVHFDTAINVTGGTPWMRVSPDHGPARDKYLKNSASAGSMQMCFEFALKYLKRSFV